LGEHHAPVHGHLATTRTLLQCCLPVAERQLRSRMRGLRHTLETALTLLRQGGPTRAGKLTPAGLLQPNSAWGQAANLPLAVLLHTRRSDSLRPHCASWTTGRMCNGGFSVLAKCLPPQAARTAIDKRCSQQSLRRGRCHNGLRPGKGCFAIERHGFAALQSQFST